MNDYKNKEIIFAIDLGGTSAKLALSDLEGNIFHKFTVITGKGDDVLPNIHKKLLSELNSLGISYDKVVKIGFGSKGPFDDKKGIVLNAGDIGWINYPAKSMAKKIFDREIVITNDSRSAAIGEWRRGKGKNYKNFLCLTLGKGIGCGIILDNKLWTGPRNIAGEIGHGGFMQDKKQCGCGLKYCTEGLSSATSIEWNYQNYIAKFPNSSLAKLQKKLGRDITIKDTSDLIKAHDKDVMESLKDSFKPLASRISLAIFLLDLEAVLVGGGPSIIGDSILEPIKYWMKQCTWDSIYNHVVITTCKLGNDAGIIGVVENTLDHIRKAN